MREIRTLRAMWRALETGPRQLLNGHEEGNLGHSQGVAYGLPRQFPTLPRHKPGEARAVRSMCGPQPLLGRAPLPQSPRCHKAYG